MHASVILLHVQTGAFEEAVHLFQNSVMPAARALQGFKDVLFLTAAATGKVVVITLWETEADLMANETSDFYRAQIAKIGGIIATLPVRETYAVRWLTRMMWDL